MFELQAHADIRVAWALVTTTTTNTTACQDIHLENYRAADLLITAASAAGNITVAVSQETASGLTTGAAGRVALGTAYATTIAAAHVAGNAPALVHVDSSVLNEAGGFSWITASVTHAGADTSVGTWVCYRPRYAPPLNATV